MIGADDIARRRHAAHVAVRHGLVDMQCQSLTNAVWQLKAKASGVAGVQLEDIDALGFHPKCFLIQRSSDVGMHMIQSIRACNHFSFSFDRSVFSYGMVRLISTRPLTHSGQVVYVYRIIIPNDLPKINTI